MSSHPFGKFQSIGIDVTDHDIAGTCVFGDRGGHDSDWPRASDQHVFTEYRKGEGGVNGITKGIKDRCRLGIDVVVVVPNIRHRQRQILCESPRAVDADTFRVGAQMAAAGQAIATAPADHVAFSTDDFPGMKIGDIRSHCYDFADETRVLQPEVQESSYEPSRPNDECVRRFRRYLLAKP